MDSITWFFIFKSPFHLHVEYVECGTLNKCDDPSSSLLALSENVGLIFPMIASHFSKRDIIISKTRLGTIRGTNNMFRHTHIYSYGKSPFLLGKSTISMENHHLSYFSWENPLFQRLLNHPGPTPHDRKPHLLFEATVQHLIRLIQDQHLDLGRSGFVRKTSGHKWGQMGLTRSQMSMHYMSNTVDISIRDVCVCVCICL